MARQPRCMLPAYGVFHVTTRGVARQNIVRDDHDRDHWAQLVRGAISHYSWDCIAWILLDNHFHLLVETSRERLSDRMQRLNGRYAQAFNERHGRDGHLFGDRFRARVIRDEDHLGSATVYVLDNAARAGLCDYGEAWPWSGGRGLGARVHRRERGRPRAERRDLSVAPVETPESERVLGLHHLVD